MIADGLLASVELDYPLLEVDFGDLDTGTEGDAVLDAQVGSRSPFNLRCVGDEGFAQFRTVDRCMGFLG